MRKKKTPPPLFAVKHDFVESLDEFLAKAMVLSQAVSSVLELKAVDEKLAPILQEKLDAFNKALMSGEN